MTHDFNRTILDETSHRPWPMPARPWLMTQTWLDLLFAHWPLDPRALRDKVPEQFVLDLFDGLAWVGVVPFSMSNVGPRGVPSLPGISAFPELNVRTYVRVADRPGVFFFSLDAGSAVAANGQAGMAMLVTQISPAVAALTWMAIEWMRFGKPSVLGFATGAIAGLAAITPGSGTVGPLGAMAIGFASGAACFVGATWLKRIGGYDDSLDAFGVHGIGGLLGTILVGVFASERFGGQVAGLDIAKQLGVQISCAAVTIVWSVGVSWIVLKAIGAAIGLRPEESDERTGLDLSLHNESGYNH